MIAVLIATHAYITRSSNAKQFAIHAKHSNRASHGDKVITSDQCHALHESYISKTLPHQWFMITHKATAEANTTADAIGR